MECYTWAPQMGNSSQVPTGGTSRRMWPHARRRWAPRGALSYTGRPLLHKKNRLLLIDIVWLPIYRYTCVSRNISQESFSIIIIINILYIANNKVSNAHRLLGKHRQGE